VDSNIVTETQIGTTRFVVERVFRKDARENAYQAIKRLLLQKAGSERRDMLSECYHDSLASYEPSRQYGRDIFGKE